VLPIGVAGEIYIGGAGVATGYHARPDLTSERFLPDPFSAEPDARLYRTGDLGRWRSDGQLQHLGRADDQIKLRGYRIELAEIEQVLMGGIDIEQAVVAPHTAVNGDVRLVAYVVTRDASPLDAESLRGRLRSQLPEYMVPSAFVPLQHLPLTPNGKVDRRALPDPGIIDAVRKSALTSMPQTATEQRIAALWCELLGINSVDVADTFLDLGGHSLLIMRAVTRLEASTGVRISPRSFVFQTLRQIAAEFDQLQAAGPAVPATPTLSAAPLSRRVLNRLLNLMGSRQ